MAIDLIRAYHRALRFFGSHVPLSLGIALIFFPMQGTYQLRVDGERLNTHLSALAEFGKNAKGGVTRVAYSEADLRAREYVMILMRRARLDVSFDPAGNMVGRREGRSPDLPVLMIGSHIDTVPEGGKYDGAVGSLGAIEVAQTLAEHNITTQHPLEVVIFQNEEHGSIGSRALSGEFTGEDLRVVGPDGKSRWDGIKFIGGDPSRIRLARRKPGDIAAYLELHIEQGSTLDENGIDIGIVEGIAGNNRWEVTIDGVPNHAGATPMNKRKDALLAAAKFIETVNRIVTSVPGRQVGTVGQIQVFPNAPNVVPGKVILSLEMRDLDRAKVDSLYARIVDEAQQQISAATGTRFSFKSYHDKKPALTDDRIRRLISESLQELGLTGERMPSSAGHDSQNISLLAPMGMIFIPSVAGISHAPDEFSRPRDITNGANVLLHSVLKIDNAKFD